jgi:tetratricopeptide (TPR) repeat protein
MVRFLAMEWRRLSQHNPQMRAVGVVRDQIRRGAFDDAFTLAERLLDERPGAEIYEALTCPIEGRGVELHEILERLERHPGTDFAPWRTNLRVGLLERLEWGEMAFLESAELTRFPDRYGWMRFHRAEMLRTGWEFAEARREFEAVFTSAPRMWKALMCAAECVLCQGDDDEAFTIADRCVAMLPGEGVSNDLENARVWRGEMRLWTGRYPEALVDLDQAAGRRVPLALGWRGAVRLQLGDLDAALTDLDAAVALAPSDAEALVWRGEVRLGRSEWCEAISDFDRAAAIAGSSVWPFVGRSLAKAGSGDGEGALADFNRIPGRVTRFFEWKLGIRVAGDPRQASRVLDAARKAARGVRRSERYLIPLWMKLR